MNKLYYAISFINIVLYFFSKTSYNIHIRLLSDEIEIEHQHTNPGCAICKKRFHSSIGNLKSVI